jgi:hypothetical protein
MPPARGNRTAQGVGDAKLMHPAGTFAGWPALAITSDAVDRYADDRLAAGRNPEP